MTPDKIIFSFVILMTGPVIPISSVFSASCSRIIREIALLTAKA
jgi:hypothetical protein